LLRARRTTKDFTGKKISEVMKKGGLIPTPVIFKLWVDRVDKLKSKKNLKGFIIDGSPRKIFEVYLMDELLEWYEWKENLRLVLIHISDKEAIWRLTKRRQCEKCKEIIPFVGEFRKVKKCPKCGGRLVKRSDDTLAAVKNRLKWFKTDVQPIINYYRRTGRLIKINGEQPIEGVFKDVLKSLK